MIYIRRASLSGCLKIGSPDIRSEIRTRTPFGRRCAHLPDPEGNPAPIGPCPVLASHLILPPITSEELELIRAQLVSSRVRPPMADVRTGEWAATRKGTEKRSKPGQWLTVSLATMTPLSA